MPQKNRQRWQALQKGATPGARAGAQQWYRMAAADAAADDASDKSSASIDLYGSIGGWWGVEASTFVSDLRGLDVDEISVHINSGGGDVFDGIAIMNALRQHRATVTCYVDGLAASAASFIAVGAGDEVVMGRNAEMMIHDAWGICIGDAAEMRRMGEDLDRVSNNVASVYADRAGGEVSAWREVMLAETWYSDAEAVEAGLADRIAGKDEVDDTDEHVEAPPEDDEGWEDRFDLTVFAHAGRRAAPAPRMPGGHRTPTASAAGRKSTPTTEGGPAVAFSDAQLDNLRRLAGVASNADEGTILAALDEALTDEDRAPKPAAQAVPEGMVMMDADTAAQLKADAAAGRAARDQQIADERTTLVKAAVADGRISPARREHWLNQLKADPGSADVLANLEPGLIPVTENGYDGANLRNDDSQDTDSVRDSAEYKNWSF